MRELGWNPESGRIEIRFPYHKQLVAVVRDLPGRRWHPDEKQWSVPKESLSEVAHRLLPLGFAPSDPVREMLDAPDAPPPTPPPPATTATVSESSPAPKVDLAFDRAADEETLTVSALNDRVRAVLRREFRQTFWVVGEVVGFDRNSHKQHVFFSLAEKEEGDDAARATVTAVLFASARSTVDRTLAEAGGGLAFQDGVRVRLEMSVDLYPKTGSFQLIVSSIDPSFTLGEIALRRERILKQVREAGLLEKNRSIPFPMPPLRIGLITSQGSDAYNDFLSELSRSPYAFDVRVADVHVQGERLEREVLAALARFETDEASIDVVVITRGGGSRTDLMGFDTPDLAFAVARSPLKIVIGIGHQQDRSVLDEVAHSEKTPTAAAARLVALCREAEDFLASAAETLARELARGVAEARGRLALWRDRLHRGARARVTDESQRWQRGGEKIVAESQRSLREETQRLRRLQEEVPRRARRGVAAGRTHAQRSGLQLSALLAARLTAARERLARNRDGLTRGAARGLERARDRGEQVRQELRRRASMRLREQTQLVEARAERVAARDPVRILARGYAWIRTADGRTVPSVEGLSAGDPVIAQLRDGQVEATVDRVEKAEEPPAKT